MDFSQFKTRYALRLDPQQEAAVQTVDGPVLLLAVPGSGKTTVLVSRLGYLLHVRGIPAGSILTMTYTVAAAGDMRQRYAAFFGPEEAARLEFRTINGVCSRVIRLYEQEYGRTAFSLLEENRKSALLAELFRAQSREFATESTVKGLATAITYAKNQMLADGELDQLEVEGCDFPALYRTYCQRPCGSISGWTTTTRWSMPCASCGAARICWPGCGRAGNTCAWTKPRTPPKFSM